MAINHWINVPVLFLFSKCVLAIQPCLTLCNPLNCSPSGSSVHGILQARILEQAAISSSRGSSQTRDGTLVSCIFYPKANSITALENLKSYNRSALIYEAMGKYVHGKLCPPWAVNGHGVGPSVFSGSLLALHSMKPHP